MANYSLKAEVISSGMVDEYKRIKSSLWHGSDYVPQYDTQLDYSTAKYEADFFRNNNPEEWKECERCANNEWARIARLKSRIAHFMSLGQCIFVTLTFTNDVLAKTSAVTRRRYVTRYLKSQSEYYIANVDYGTKNEREHYHCIVLADKIDYSVWNSTYGGVKGIKVKSPKDVTKLAKYVSKLTNHAIKATTKRNAIIYSKHIFSGYDKNSRHIGGGFIEVDDTWSSIQDDREEILKNLGVI